LSFLLPDCSCGDRILKRMPMWLARMAPMDVWMIDLDILRIARAQGKMAGRNVSSTDGLYDREDS
jgi:hypothetical protein